MARRPILPLVTTPTIQRLSAEQKSGEGKVSVPESIDLLYTVERMKHYQGNIPKWSTETQTSPRTMTEPQAPKPMIYGFGFRRLIVHVIFNVKVLRGLTYRSIKISFNDDAAA